MDKTKDAFNTWNEQQLFSLNDLAKVYGELVVIKEYSTILERISETNEDTREMLEHMFRLDALNRIK